MWSLSDSENCLTTREKSHLIEQFAELSPNGEVVFTGGEPLLKSQELFDLVAVSRSHGLISSSNCNGSLLDQKNAVRIMREGPNYFVLSLDSHRFDVHDYHRGVQGAFAQTVKAISAMVQIGREMSDRRTEVLINAVISDLNVSELEELLRFAEELGVDGVTFQMLSPTFHRIGVYDKFFENHFFPDKPRAIQKLQEIIDSYENFPILKTTRSDMFWMQKYIINPMQSTRPVCNSHERNIVVDHAGNVRLCFNMSKILNGKVLGDARIEGLDRLWFSGAAEQARDVMQNCRLSCGILNCHRKKDL